MRRLGLVFLALVGCASPVAAQRYGQSPWSTSGASYFAEPQQARSQSRSAYAAAAARRARARDDDDDFEFSDAPKSPTVLDGGGRPDIGARAPQSVSFHAGFAPGSIVIDTGSRALYYVRDSGSAYRYPISVGRDGFRWRGTEKISRVAAWPDWHPPAEMRQRDPRLPEVMTGGIRNPLGAKALYLGNSLYRIHGTNDAKSIGYAASSGCFRMMNYHVLHLATLAGPGTTVHVLEHLPGGTTGQSKARLNRSQS